MSLPLWLVGLNTIALPMLVSLAAFLAIIFNFSNWKISKGWGSLCFKITNSFCYMVALLISLYIAITVICICVYNLVGWVS